MAGAVELATAYIALVPSMKGAAGKISEQLNPAAAEAGGRAGDGLGSSIIGTAAKWAAPLAAALGFGSILKTGFDEAKDAAAGTAQLAAGIESTGNAANVSVEGMNSLASEIQNYSGQTDDSIVKSEQLLLTFTNIKNNGPDKIFDLATKASADMAAKMGGDASSNAVLLGKALNDPVKGISALTRVGVAFTDGQKESIKAMVAAGDTAGAQKIILKELGTEFGGAAEAAGRSFPGQLSRVHRAFEDLSQGVVQGFLPLMGNGLEGVIKILQKITPAISGAAQSVADKAGQIGAAIGAVFSLLKTGDFTGGIGKALGVEEDSKVIDVLFRIRDAALVVTGGFRAFGAAWRDNNGDVTSDGFAGVMERIANGLREGVGGIRAFFAAFVAGGDDITSSGFAGFLEGLGLQARRLFDAISPAMAPVVAAFSTLIPQVMGLWSAFSPLQIILNAVMPLLPQLVGMFGQIAGVIGSTLTTALTTLVPMFMQLSAVVSQALGGVLAAVLPMVVQMITMLGQTLSKLLPIIMPIIATIIQLAMTLMAQLMPIIMQLVAMVLPMVVTIFGAILQAIGPVIQMVAGLLIPIIMALMPVVVVVFGVIADIITSVMQIIMGVIQVVTGIISGNWEQVWSGILNIFGGIWNLIASVVIGALAIIGSVVIAGLGLVGGFVGSVLGNIGQFFADTWNNIIGGVSGFIGNLLGFFSGLPGQIMGFLSGAGQWLFDAGKNIIEGLINGVKSMMGAIGNAILGLIPGPIVGVFKAALGIESPSKVFRALGKHIPEGLVLGLGDGKGAIESTMAGLVSVPDVPSFSAGISSPAVASASNGSNGGFPDSLRLVVDGHEFMAYVDGRVSSGMDGTATMARGRR